MFYVYIIQSQKNSRYYIGSTEDIQNRVYLHNLGRVRSTRAYRPWKIIHEEQFSDRNTAYNRELEIKSYKGGHAFKKLVPK